MKDKLMKNNETVETQEIEGSIEFEQEIIEEHIEDEKTKYEEKNGIRVTVSYKGFCARAYDSGNSYIFNGNPDLKRTECLATLKVPVIKDFERISELEDATISNLVDYVNKFGGYKKSYVTEEQE